MMKAKMAAGGGMMSKMKAGGGVKSLEQHASMPASKAHAGLKKGGMAKAKMGPSKMGSVKTAAPSKDGVAVKGKTKGKMVAMRGR